MEEDKQILISCDTLNEIPLEEDLSRTPPLSSQYNDLRLSFSSTTPTGISTIEAPESGRRFTDEDWSDPATTYDPALPHRPCTSGPNDTTPNVYGQVKNFKSRVSRRFLRCYRSVSRLTSVISQTFMFHGKLLLSSFLLTLSSSGILIFFPLHLENISRHDFSDGYSACFSASTMSTLLLLFNCLVQECYARKNYFRNGSSYIASLASPESVLKPLINWQSAAKIGFCLGLSTLTVFYSWENDKVPCNFQDPLLGLVIIFAIITHAVSHWTNVGLKRTFALSAIACGVFVSVDYPLVDHHRCRGYYYRNQPNDLWSWKVNLVWTLSFVVSIWLSTVAAFFLEGSIPVPKVKHTRLYDLEYNAVKLRVMNNNESTRQSGCEDISNSENYPHILKSYRFSPYIKFHVSLISNAVLWFAVSTWAVIASLFWTEFIPGFGKGVGVSGEKLPERILMAFRISLNTGSSWALFISLFVFAHAFTYLIVLTRSPIVAISVAVLGFPIIGLWWSAFQITNSFFVWMPVFSGELVCAFLGLGLIAGGCYYLIKFEVCNPAKIKKSGNGGLPSTNTYTYSGVQRL